jgi:hypothetical protein
MAARKVQTVDAINEYLSGLKAKGLGDAKLKIVTWDSRRYDVIYDGKVKECPGIPYTAYVCGDTTPLYDSIARGIKDLARSRKSKKLLVVMTDGQENSSINYRKNNVRDLIEVFRSAGSEIIFLGNDIDVTREGDELGTRSDYTISYATKDSGAVYRGAVTIATTSFFSQSDSNDDLQKSS